MSVDIERAIGRLEACVSSLKSDMEEMKADVKAMRSTVDQAKGGWKVLAAVGAISGAAGGAIMKVATMVLVVPR